MPDARAGDTDWRPGTVLLEDYEVERHLGRGGMGSVYLVRSRSSHEPFAVKRALPELVQSARHRRAFLQELITWSQLPEHSNLTSFRFFRSTGTEILLFAEFVQGGSLQDWLDQDRIRDPAEALDLAIQTAWGLHVAHRAGVIHQDVKPGNILIRRCAGETFTAKLTDFGLARARTTRDRAALGTPAFRSPEQAMGAETSPETDVWSWGLTVLALFSGGTTWLVGPLAQEVLEERVRHVGRHPEGLEMPIGLVEILHGCFQADPRDRWPDFSRVVAPLKELYRDLSGQEYPRRLRPAARSGPTTPEPLIRRSLSREWKDPRIWFRQIFRELDRPPDDAEGVISVPFGSARAQAIADLASLEEARRMLEELVNHGREDLRESLGRLHADKALIHFAVHDEAGAVAHFDRAEELLVRCSHEGAPHPDLPELVSCRAIVHQKMEDFEAALQGFDRVIRLQKDLAEPDSGGAADRQMALALLNKAAALCSLERKGPAITLLQEAVRILEDLLDRHRDARVVELLAAAVQNLGAVLAKSGRNRRALEVYERAVDMLESLPGWDHDDGLLRSLSSIHLNRATALQALGRSREALEAGARSVRMREHLVRRTHLVDHRRLLAAACMTQANSLQILGEIPESLVLHRRAVGIWRRLHRQEGRHELAHSLALSLMNMGNALVAGEWLQEARRAHDEALGIWSMLVEREDRHELEAYLAMALTNQARGLEEEGRFHLAHRQLEAARSRWDRLVKGRSRTELEPHRATCRSMEARVLLALGRSAEAHAAATAARDAWTNLVASGRSERRGDRALARILCVLADQGGERSGAARREARAGWRELQDEIARTGRRDLQRVADHLRSELELRFGRLEVACPGRTVRE